MSDWNVGTGQRLSGAAARSALQQKRRVLRAQSETLASVSSSRKSSEADDSDSEDEGGDAWNTGGSRVAAAAADGSAKAAAGGSRKMPGAAGPGGRGRRRASVAEGTNLVGRNVAEFLQGIDGTASARALHDSGLFDNLGGLGNDSSGGLFEDVSDSDSSLENFDDSISSLPFISPSFATGSNKKTVRDLVERRKWMKLLKVLPTSEGREQVRASCGGFGGGSGPGSAATSAGNVVDELLAEGKTSHDYETYDGTALHHAVSRGASLKVVRAVVSAGGDALWSGDAPKKAKKGPPKEEEEGGGKCCWPVVDSAGRTALHAAAASTSYNPDGMNGGAVVAYLIALTKNTGASVSALTDARGRTPLHLACMERPNDDRVGGDGVIGGGDCRGHGRAASGGKARRKLSAGIIRALADAAPSAVRAEDDAGMTPLDYAVVSVTGGNGDDKDGNGNNEKKFVPDGKRTAWILAEDAIFPMVRHCHGLLSERTAAAREAAKAKAKAAGTDDDDDDQDN